MFPAHLLKGFIISTALLISAHLEDRFKEILTLRVIKD